MEIMRVTTEWGRAGVHYVRVESMCQEFHVSIAQEFESDTPEDLYVLALDDILPVSTCRIRLLEDGVTGKIERVATVGSYRSQGVGSLVIREAERWLAELGAKRIVISSRLAALRFYERLGYQSDGSPTTGAGEFVCQMVEKELDGKEGTQDGTDL
jgi:GNAT superfamily N-acetyltransferase